MPATEWNLEDVLRVCREETWEEAWGESRKETRREDHDLFSHLIESSQVNG
jgi:hypothetical protein